MFSSRRLWWQVHYVHVFREWRTFKQQEVLCLQQSIYWTSADQQGRYLLQRCVSCVYMFPSLKAYIMWVSWVVFSRNFNVWLGMEKVALYIVQRRFYTFFQILCQLIQFDNAPFYSYWDHINAEKLFLI